MEDVPSTSRNFICFICQERFEDEVEFLAHLALHDINTPGPLSHPPQEDLEESVDICGICNKTFQLEEISRNNYRKYTCPICDEHFEKSFQLAEHLFIDEKFDCKYCKAAFKEKQLLLQHLSTVHLDIRKYKSSNYKKLVEKKSAIRTHEDALGLNTYRCTFCGEQFHCKQQLEKHMMNNHEYTLPSSSSSSSLCSSVSSTVSLSVSSSAASYSYSPSISFSPLSLSSSVSLSPSSSSD